MPAADGSIIIDTKIPTAGMNAGVKAVSNSFEGLRGTVKKTTQSLAQAFLGGKNFATIFKNIAKFSAAALIGGSLISSIRNLAGSFDLASSSIGDKVKPLSAALETLKGTFVNLIVTAFVPMIPHLIAFATWLTKILMTVTQVVAALFGFKKTVGSVMTSAAAGAKKAAKEARGALAAFDQINLLQKQEGPSAEAGAGTTPAPITVPQELLDKVEALKEKVLEFFRIVMDVWEQIRSSPLWKFIGEQIQWLWNNVLVPFGTWLIAKLKEIGVWIRDNVLTISSWGDVWKLILNSIVDYIKWAFGNLMSIVQFVLDSLVVYAQWAWGNFQKIVSTVFGWIVSYVKWAFGNLMVGVDFLKSGFGSALDWIKNKFTTIFNGIKDFVRGVIDGIIGYIASLVQSILAGIAAISGVNAGPGSIGGGVRTSIPHLATGAVIPPNATFAAILGDQRSGRNIEAPENLIRQIMREELGGGGDLNLTLPVYLDGEKDLPEPKANQYAAREESCEMTIIIDSTTFNIPILSIKRKAEFLDKYAERTEDGVLHRELIGVYFNYELAFGRTTDTAEYVLLWAKLTEVEEFHEVTVPDFDGTGGQYTFQAYFAGVSDSLRRETGAKTFWKDLVVNFIAQSPA